MRLYLLLLLIPTYLVYAQECNSDNLVNSDDDPDFLSISVEGEQPTGPIDDIYKQKAIFLVSNNVVTIKSSLGSNVLMQVSKFKAEFFKVNFAQLVMKDSANNILYDESQATEETWTEVEWNLGDGIVDVTSIELSFKAPAAELKVRNLFLEVCILVGWCPWSAWNKCSVTCGGGDQSSSRTCTCPNPDPDRFKCPPGPSEKEQECNTDCCKKPPSWDPWAQWGDCSVSCGGGERSRNRKCIDDPCPDETKCPGKSKETETCNTDCCKKPPSWGPWTAWSKCSVTCETGSQERSRECIPHKCDDGTDCIGDKKETKSCEQPCCPQPPSWTKWRKWSACSQTCELGERSRKRKCKKAKCPDGSKCPGSSKETEDCYEGCCPQPPNWSEWGYWEDCSVTCGGGTQKRKRTCVDDECPDDTDCPGKDNMSQKCNEDCCIIPPEWTKWGPWSECSATCGESERERKRTCKESDCPGDVKTCPGPSVEKEECDRPCCKEVINWKTRDSVKIILKSMKNMKKAKVPKNKNAIRVLKKSGKSVFLVKNYDVTQYLDVMLSQEYQILKIEVETLLASNVTVTTSPTGLPPGQGVSQVPDADIGEQKWNKHNYNFGESGVGPIDNIRLDFGFKTGEIKARNLEITVCPPEY